MAGLVNYFASSTVTARYKTVAQVHNSITLSSGGKEVSVTILNQLSTTAGIGIKYMTTDGIKYMTTASNSETSNNTLIIILAILTAGLVISVAIVIFFLNKTKKIPNIPRISNIPSI